MAVKEARATTAITEIPLEQPASVKRQIPSLSDGWLLPDYYVGPENEGLRFLFDPRTLQELTKFSPVLLFGEQKLGKTALAITLAVQWSKLTESRPLCFTTGQAFAENFAASIEIDDIDSFRKRHRNCKMLVIDNIDALAGKSAAQSELCATLDVLADASCPTIVTALQLPSSTKGLSAKLISRLCAGYSLRLAKPSNSTQLALIEAFVGSIDKRLPASKLFSLLPRLGALPTAYDLRDLVTVAHQNKAADGSLDFEVISSICRQLMRDESPTVASIAKLVAKRLRIKLVDMRASTRQANVVRARGLAIHLSRRLTTSSLQSIGQFFGGRDHSTILHACRKTEQLLESDTELANLCRDLMFELMSPNCSV